MFQRSGLLLDIYNRLVVGRVELEVKPLLTGDFFASKSILSRLFVASLTACFGAFVSCYLASISKIPKNNSKPSDDRLLSIRINRRKIHA